MLCSPIHRHSPIGLSSLFKVHIRVNGCSDMHACYCDPVLCAHPSPLPLLTPSRLFSNSHCCHCIYGCIYLAIFPQIQSSHQSVKYLFLPQLLLLRPPPTISPLIHYTSFFISLVLLQLIFSSRSVRACVRALWARVWMRVCVCAGTHVPARIVAGAQLSELSITFARR